MKKLPSLILIFLTAAATAASGNSGKRPNILLLLAEDLSPDLGSYGEPAVFTPNLDALADRGVRYTEVFATSSVCSPSRSALYTGMYQTSIDSHQHRNFDPKPLPAEVPFLIDLFRESGYFVFNGSADDRTEEGKLDINFIPPAKPFDGTHWSQRPEGKPFFGIIQFEETHRDFARDPENPIDPETIQLPPYYPDHRLARRDWADYLEDVQILDRKVGRILGQLEEADLEDTLVIFVADHGRPMPRAKQFLYDPALQVPLIASWPGHLPEGVVDNRLLSLIDLIPSCLSAAGIAPPQNIDGRPLLFSDTPGREFVFAARDRTGEAADRIRMIRSKDWKLLRNFHPTRPYTVFSAYKEIQYPILHLMRMLYFEGELNEVQAQFMGPTRPFEELYALGDDPHEINNLADLEEYQQIRNDLAIALDEWIVETDDAGSIPEDYETEVDWFLRNQQWYKQTLEERDMVGEDTPERHVEYWTERLLGTHITSGPDS